MEKAWTGKKIIEKSFVDMAAIYPDIKNLQELVKELEEISQRAGMMAQYLDEREGYGCGDQGHDKALKAMNRAGRIIHVRVFGYNTFRDLKF